MRHRLLQHVQARLAQRAADFVKTERDLLADVLVGVLRQQLDRLRHVGSDKVLDALAVDDGRQVVGALETMRGVVGGASPQVNG